MKDNQKRIAIALLIALVGFPQISETIYTPALPSIVSGLNTSAYMVEATLAIYFLGCAFGVLLWGTISDYLGRRYVMLLGLLIYGVATLRCANVESAESLLFWRFFQAFGASVGSIITQTIIRDVYKSVERTQLFSIISGALAFSPAFGPLLGGVISQYLGWRANFWFLMAMSVVLFIWTFSVLKETLPENMERLSIIRLRGLISSMMASHQLWGHILLIAGTNGILFGFYQEAPFIFIEQMGMQPKLYGCFGILIAGATILAARISHRKSDLSPQVLIQRGTFIVFGGGIVFLLSVLIGLLPLMILALFVTFFGVGLIIPNSLSHALKPYQYAAGTAGSIFGGCYYCLIAGCMWGMSAFHNGGMLLLPLYMTLLGAILLVATRMIRVQKSVESWN